MQPCYVALRQAHDLELISRLEAEVLFIGHNATINMGYAKLTIPRRDSNLDRPDHDLINKRIRLLGYGTQLDLSYVDKTN